MPKVAIVVLADLNETHGDLGRIVNALETAKEFKEAGDEVQIIFDGGGTASAVALADPEHRMHKLWTDVEDVVEGLCRYCAQAFHVYEEAQELELPMLAEFEQHPSLHSRIVDGYQVITF